MLSWGRSGETDRARPRRRRGAALALLAVAILLLHATVLNGVAWSWHRPAAVPTTAAMQVRSVVPEPAAPPPRVAAAEPAAAARPAPRRARPAPPMVPARMPLHTLVPESVRPAAAELASEALPLVAPAPDLPPEPPPPLAAVSPVSADRTRVPPTILLSYELRRGLLRGSAELQWESREDEYALSFDARVAGFSILKQTSAGGLDATGLAPLRFTDQRAGRETRATNFQREAGKITFSGPGAEFPLAPGTQDRLSWMIQLAAIVSADPRRREPGGEVAMGVVGTRADLASWLFRYVGDETVDTGLGRVLAAKFVRERRDAYDTNVEIWLDPARYHLPARAVLRAGPDDEGLELRLRQATGQP